MGEEIDPKLLKEIRLTQEVLGEFVKKPSLSDKHLSRPPFRYLHDVIMTVIDSTGFFRGLFTPDELNPEHFKSKELKAAFVEKIVAVVEIASGEKLDIKASKVLAGQEVDKTNALLQTLGKCLQKKMSSNEAVKSVTGIDPGNDKQQANGAGGSNSKEQVAAAVKGKVAGDPGNAKGKRSSIANESGATKTKQPAAVATGRVSQGEKGSKKAAASTQQAKPADNSKPGKAAGASNKPAKPAATGASPYANTVGKAMAIEKSSKTKPTAPTGRRGSIPDDGAGDGAKQTKRKSSPSPARRPSVGSSSTKPTAEDNGADDPKPKALIRQGSFTVDKPKRRDSNGAQQNEIMPGPPEINSEQPMADQASSEMMGGRQVNQPVEESDTQSNQRENSAKNRPGPSGVGNSKLGGEFASSENINDTETEKGPEVEAHANISPGIGSSSLPPIGPGFNENEGQGQGQTEAKIPPARGETTKGRGRPDTRGNHRQRESDQMAINDNENRMPANNNTVTRPPVTTMKGRPPTVRPISARPGAPRPRSALVVQVDENAYRPPTGKVTVLMDNEEQDEDGDNYVVQELPPSSKMLEELEEAPEMGSGLGGDLNAAIPENQRGLLLDQILESKKELEGERRASMDDGGAGDNERVQHIRESAKAEVERLQKLIQKTAQSAHPLGKLMDFIQEDVDSIHKELNKWVDESKKIGVQLEEVRSKSDDRLDPLRKELAQVKESIQNQEDAITTTRLSIQNNEERIQKLLSSFENKKRGGEFNRTIELPPVVKVFGMEVPLKGDERLFVFGDGSPVVRAAAEGLEAVAAPPTTRQRPPSHYKISQLYQPDLEPEIIKEPQIPQNNKEVSDLEMRARMKNLAAAMARQNSKEAEMEVDEFNNDALFSRPVAQRRKSLLGSETSSPTSSPGQSMQFM